MQLVFDGHNDVLLRLRRSGKMPAYKAFLDGEVEGHIDLPKAKQGGFPCDLGHPQRRSAAGAL